MPARARGPTETETVTLTPSFEIAQGRLWTMRWILLALFGASFVASTIATFVLIFLVGYGEIVLPQELLISLATATVLNIFPGLTYVLAFAFGKIPEE